MSEVKAPENPPAFPSGPASGNWGVAHLGMTLRDYFAGQAIVIFEQEAYTHPEKAAAWAYNLADAMLKERAK